MAEFNLDAVPSYTPYVVGGVVVLLYVIYTIIKDATFSKKLLNSRMSSESETEQKKDNSKANISYGKIYLFFGSQTGTAARFCNVLAEEATNNNFEPVVSDLQDFDPETFVEPKLAIFCMANHGQGDPTDNAQGFFKWLISDDKGSEVLKELKFTVFGLGNKQYQFYNQVGKKTNEGLEKLGGNRIYRYGEGDDDGSLEDDFEEWKTDLWKELKEKVESHEIDESEKTEGQCPFTINFSKGDLQEVNLKRTFSGDKSEKVYDFQAKTYLECKEVKIAQVRELRQNNEEGSTVHIEFDIKDTGLKYQTAANLYVYPENDPKLVETAAERIGAKLDDIFVIEENQKAGGAKFKHPFPSPISVKNYLTRFCDLQGPVKKNVLGHIIKLVEDKSKKEKLERMASAAGKSEYESEIIDQSKGLLDILIEYDIKLDLKELIALADTIKPRYFTISSSAVKDPESIHICASLVELKSDRNKRLGLASGYYKRILDQFTRNPDAELVARVNVKESAFYLPEDSNRPLIFVGPGAGVAPFVGMLYEKELLANQGEEQKYGDVTLYFGCRKRDSDYIYKEEIENFKKNNIINNYYLALSRDEERCYVQSLMKKNLEEISKALFDQNGVLYICGSVRMGNDVLSMLGKIVTDYFKVSAAEGALKIKSFEQDRTIIKELWG